ncbi:Glutathione S-transferase 2 [Grifola frondosa]|uniref:Glutathione S-transferase 2 n=1 Tax=Grifola frondosa TaxID=5627 RepID=A0A1C7MCF0_GRIFR|nr:Glutathione S-transferase 2 [Grifola frondosa]
MEGRICPPGAGPLVPSAVKRYQKEAIRVLGVLESVFSKQEWLVGDKCTIADISFVPWNIGLIRPILVNYEGFNFEKDFPAVSTWHKKVAEREAIAAVLAIRASLT